MVVETETVRKRMRSGDRPGLQNRRAASSMLPVCSTHTRFRHFSTTYRQRKQSEISSLWPAPCERLSSEIAPSHPSRHCYKHSSWCGCPHAASAFAGRRLTSPQRRTTRVGTELNPLPRAFSSPNSSPSQTQTPSVAHPNRRDSVPQSVSRSVVRFWSTRTAPTRPDSPSP